MTKGFVLEKIDGKGLFAGFKDLEDLLLDEVSYLFGFLKLSPFQALLDTFDQLLRCLHSKVGLEEKALQFIEKILIDRLFPQEKAIDLFDKTLMGF